VNDPVDPRERSFSSEEWARIQRMTPGERMELVWKLTLQAWRYEEGDEEPRMRRDVGRIIRPPSAP
jgi:hypothetical protein